MWSEPLFCHISSQTDWGCVWNLLVYYWAYTPMSQTIMTRLICRWSSAWYQNGSDLPRYGLYKTSVGALWYLAVTRWSCNGLFQHISQTFNWNEIWGIWRPGHHHELFVMLLKPFLNNLCCVAGRITQLEEVHNNALVGDICQIDVHMNARTHGFPAEHTCIRPST